MEGSKDKGKTVVVCIKCRQPWTSPNNPAICPKCGQSSVGISVPIEERGR